MWFRPLAWSLPPDAAARLRPLGGLAFLDSAAPGGPNGRWSLVAAAPSAEFTASLAETRFAGRRLAAAPFVALDTVLARYRLAPPPGAPPFCGGLVGFLAFEAAHLLETLARPRDLGDDRALVSLGLYDTALVFDHDNASACLVSAGFDETLDASAPEPARRRRAEARMDAFEAALANPTPVETGGPVTLDPAGWRSDRDASAYAAMVEAVRETILDGDIFQANMARRLEADLPPDFDAFGFYRRLRGANPAPYGAYLERPDRIVASSSPELFLRLRGGLVETRPIKGTARRGADQAADAAAAAALQTSEKDRAENVMIVDLLRNDLSRVCEPESVEVPLLCALESFAGLHHLVSAVTGRLKPGVGAGALLAASFPGGSITGAPKIRAIDVITEHEERSRSLYCGSIAALSFTGDADLSIAIRTVEFAGNRVVFGTGGGVTVLSNGADEYRETETKAARILAAFAPDPA
ncbi:anthranilate synthase component I family protein [Aureimonas pseudogalii]|uniref:Para-aminobenzoate synthetase component 1 n=1 Tax=Aureimonas pseudogalii TaxID=1744844 RepID=A0A7W6EDN5_9HYPH|nr:anthranilate synthase component I family protein [Aureimonas pseudogalii]MBB3997407.1 para-aminobenzoate synthetase component 1 [Aureimonas pseudogalii]